MKYLVVLFALVGAVYGSDVLDCSDSDFKSVVGGMDVALVEFFAPWCGHCKKLAPEYEIAATSLKKNDPPVGLIKVDCTVNTDTCSKYDVSGYPTLKIFRGGELSEDYNGPRDAPGIIKLMKSKAGPSVIPIDNVEVLNAKIPAADDVSPVMLCLYEGSDLPSGYKNVAAAMSANYKFYASNNADVITEVKGAANTIMLMRHPKLANKFEDSVVTMEGAEKASKSDVESFINDNLNGLCGVMTGDNRNTFKKPYLQALYEVDYVKNAKGTNYWRNRVIKVVKEHNLGCGVSNVNEPPFSSELGNNGLPDFELDNAPLVVIFDSSKKYPMLVENGNMDGKQFMKELTSFIEKFEAGSLTPHLKSEPIPENNAPVKVAVGKNFDDIVMDKTKDVLIEFYAPWCGHCKNLAPIYDELAEKVQSDHKDVVIAKMDATANDYPSDLFEVSGFPTLYWVTVDNEIKKYQGGRDVASFMKFIKENKSKAKASDEL